MMVVAVVEKLKNDKEEDRCARACVWGCGGLGGGGVGLDSAVLEGTI